MPNTRGKGSSKATKPKVKSKVVKPTKISKLAVQDKESQSSQEVEETAYERLKRKVMDKRKLEMVSETDLEDDNPEHSKAKKSKANNGEAEVSEVTAQFVEDDNFVEMNVTDVQNEMFPNEEEGFASESDLSQPMMSQESQNNNAMVTEKRMQNLNSGTQRSLSASCGNNPDGAVPHCSNVDPEHSTHNAVNNDLQRTFALVQSFMVKKGLIDSSMDEEEIKEFLKEDKGQQKTIEPGNKKLNKSSQAKNMQATEKSKEGKLVNPANIVNPVNSKESPSEITIYKRGYNKLIQNWIVRLRICLCRPV